MKTFALSLAAGLVCGLALNATAAEARSVRAAMPVEYNAASRDHVKLAEQFQTIRDGQRVELDLRLELEAGPERVAAVGPARGKALRRSIEIGDEMSQRLQEVVCLTDINAPLNYTKQNYLRMRLFENFEHVTLKVYLGDKADFPRNDAACVYDAEAPGKKMFRLRGRFEAIVHPTQRGMVVQLRPTR
jgi:hypothetical protein